MINGSERVLPVILSGGSGTRLWPVSRAVYPKQLLPLVGATSLLQQTVERVRASDSFAPPVVICNQEHRFLVAEQMAAIGQEGARILLEPVGRNTAPAACLAALLAEQESPEALVMLLPSDHHVTDQAAFGAAVAQAAAAARDGWLMTFGIAPDRPETGYGYIAQGDALAGRPGCYRVAQFTEKPDRATAEGYLDAGGHSWNSGMFLFRADRLLEELERFEPDIVAACRTALAGAKRDIDFLRLDKASFGQSPSISLDYAVMERTDRAAVVPDDIGWSDVGSWDSLWSIAARDQAGNDLRGDVIALDCRNSSLRSDRRLIAALGVEDLVVVSTDDVVLVCPRARSQEVGALVERLKGEARSETLHHTKVYRPWGSYQHLDSGARFQVKRLILHPGASISLQRHMHRAEHWVVVRGTAEVTRDNELYRLYENESTYITMGATHRLHNPGVIPLEIVEVQSGSYLGEDDIERFEDGYGRTEGSS